MAANSLFCGFCLLIVGTLLVFILQSAIVPKEAVAASNDQPGGRLTLRAVHGRHEMKFVDGEFDSISKILSKIDCTDNSSYADNDTLSKTLSFLSEEAILQRTGDCDSYHEAMDFFGQEVSFARLSLISESPLAFSHSIHGQAGILEVFLALTFRPGDSHCFHIDAKASDLTAKAVEAIISCYNQKYPSTTMFAIQHPLPVYWGHFSVLEVSCYMISQDSTRKFCVLFVYI